jgi:hypothetical protein
MVAKILKFHVFTLHLKSPSLKHFLGIQVSAQQFEHRQYPRNPPPASPRIATLNTQWLTPTFPESTKALLAKFSALVKSKDPESGERLAHEVFTLTGLRKSSAMEQKGTEGPSSSS